MLNYDMSRLQNALKDSVFNMDMYKSNDYWLLKSAYVMLVSLNEFIDYADRMPSRYISDRGKWFRFVQIFFSKFHKTTNLLCDYLSGKAISDYDRKDTLNTIEWAFNVCSGLFPKEKEWDTPNIYDAVIAGVYHNAIYYYSKQLEKMVQEFLGMDKEKQETDEFLNMIAEENNYLGEVENIVFSSQSKIERIPREVQEDLVAMWSRTISLLANGLTEEVNKLKTVFA